MNHAISFQFGIDPYGTWRGLLDGINPAWRKDIVGAIPIHNLVTVAVVVSLMVVIMTEGMSVMARWNYHDRYHDHLLEKKK